MYRQKWAQEILLNVISIHFPTKLPLGTVEEGVDEYKKNLNKIANCLKAFQV